MTSPFHIAAEAGPGGEPRSGDDPIAVDLHAVRDRLHRARSAEPGPGRDELVQDLEVAYEELRVADEEVRAQQEQISDLVRRQEVVRSEHERLLALLPVAVLVTDRAGVVRRGNAAAGILTGRDPTRMEGKPVFAFFAPDDRPALRDLLARARSDAADGRETGHVLSRGRPEVPVQVSTSVDTEAGTVSWLLLAAGSDQSDDGVPLSQGLGRLAALPSSGATRDDVVRAAVTVCRDVLGSRTEVSVQLGAFQAPEVVASTGPLAQALDGAQLMTGEGPTACAYAEKTRITSPDAGADPRWPRWAAAVPRRDVAVVAVPVQVHEEVEGALIAYRAGGSFSGALAETVETLTLTLRALLQELLLREEIARAAEDLNRALASRAVIDQAKGIVMAQKGCSSEEAFQHLVDLASTQHVKLRQVAATIVRQVSPVVID